MSSPIRFTSLDDLVAHLEALSHVASVEAEGLSELDHGLQTADLLAADHPDDAGLLVAGLVHDLAHPWDDAGQPNHAAWGADAVRDVLGERVARLVGGHVAAKRWLVANEPDYAACLSPDSVATLAAQGGPFTEAESQRFTEQADWQAMVALRRADDGAKEPGRPSSSLDDWLPVLSAVASRAATASTSSPTGAG